MPADFHQMQWGAEVEDDCRQLIRLAIREDLADQQDWTTVALTPESRRGAARIVAREAGVAAGLPVLATLIDEMQLDLQVESLISDGEPFVLGASLGRIEGSVRDLLTSERTLLNMLSRLVGVATITSRFVHATAGLKAQVYDTRKTTPGWRRLEKYAVRCGGGRNHRTGLFDAVLIKDNHLAQLADGGSGGQRAVLAVRRARAFLAEFVVGPPLKGHLIEIEVDDLDQLRAVLPERPDIVLLDNMNFDQLRDAVEIRDELAPQIELDASGGVSLESVRAIAETGVDRISVGSLTHSAPSVDVGLDWGD